MDMVEFILGAAVGAAGGAALKDTVFGNKTTGKQADLKRELDTLSDENEKLRKRNKEAERKIEDLTAENERLVRSSKNASDIPDSFLSTLKCRLKILQTGIHVKNNRTLPAVSTGSFNGLSH